jgi:hypothetical protein
MGSAIQSTGNEKWLRRLFFALALLYVLPFWTVRYLPTTDGPCHTYNAWILRQHGNTGQYPLFQQYYEINWRPYPNWISQGTMALLMFVVPPLVAEKLLVSGYVLLFLGGAWYLTGSVRPGERWLAFLAFPFAYHQLFQFGFYNFSISLALFLFVLGCWWRNRESPGLAFAAKINLLLWLCYFSHILSFTLALAAIGVLWLATLRRESWRRHLLHISILIPQLALPLWFFMVQKSREFPPGWHFRRLLKYFLEVRVLMSFSDLQRQAGEALAILFLLLLLLTLWRKSRRRPWLDEADAFLLLAVSCAVLVFASPAGMAGGGLLKQRLCLYPFLLLIPWFSPGLGDRARKTGVAALAAAALLNLGFLTYWYRLSGAKVERFVSGLAAVQPNTRVLALFFQRTGPTDVLSHAMGYKAIEKGLIDWDNYEAKTSFFPSRFRGSVVFPRLAGTVKDPGSLRVKINEDLVDAFYTWRMPPRVPLRKRLKKSYERDASPFGGELWLRPDR